MSVALLDPPPGVLSTRYQDSSPPKQTSATITEIVFHRDHNCFWATTLSSHGQRALISMAQSTWLENGARNPRYDIYLDNVDSYLTNFQIVQHADGTVDGKQSATSFQLKPKHLRQYPWLDGAVREWIQSLDKQRIDSSLSDRAPTVHANFERSGYGVPIYRPGTYGNEDRLTSLDAPIKTLAESTRLPIDWQQNTLVFYGGLGAVVPRFYQEHLNALRKDYPVRFLAVDLLDRDQGLQAIRNRGLPYDDYCQAREFRFDRDNLPVGMVILTRPDTHFPLADLADSFGVQIFVEKPIVHPQHLREMLTLYERRQSDIFAIDFFFDNPSVAEAIKVINQGKLGMIQRMHGQMIEKQGLEPGRAEWLVTPRISGGGLGMDMMVHLTALGEMILERWGISLREAHIDPSRLIFARYPGAPDGSETFAEVSGQVGRVAFSFGAGKGLHRSAYYLIVEGSKGTIEVNLGTEDTKGFMRFTPVGDEPVITIENSTSDIGYHDTVGKILASSQEKSAISLQERNFRVHATALSVELLDKAAYMFGPNYYEIDFNQDPASIVTEPGRALSVADRSREHYRVLEMIIDAVAVRIKENQTLLAAGLFLDRYGGFIAGDNVIGHLHVDPRNQRLEVEIFESAESSSSAQALVAEVLASVSSIAKDNGWNFGEEASR